MFHNVCRLCLGTEELIWIFNEKMADNMPEIIEVTSGVQITKSDMVTQMVCSTCCQITIKMYKFRTTSIKNDKDLKARCAGYNISQLRNSIVHTKQELANTSSTVSVAASDNISSSGSSTTPNAKVPTSPTISTPTTPPVPKFQIPQKYKSAHPSIKEILKHNPNIQLPNVSMSSHFGAYITLLTDEVDDWYKEKNFTDSEIVEIKKSAAKYAVELENPTPQPQRKKRRKSSIESASSSSSKSSTSKKLPLDKSISEGATQKRKKIKPSSEVLLKPNSETASTYTISTTKSNAGVANKGNDSSVIKPVPKMVISVTKSNVSTIDKTKVHASSKSNVNPKVKLDSNSNSNTKSTLNVNTSVTKDNSNILKSSANVSSNSSATITSKYSASSDVETNVNSVTPTDGSATVRTSVSKTEWLSKGSPKATDRKKIGDFDSMLNSMLQKKDPPSKHRESDITLTSILGHNTSTTKRKFTDLVSDSDGDDAGDDPSYEPEATDDASDAEIIEIEEPGKKNERSLRKKTDQPQHRTKPKDEYTLFTTRPFIRNASSRQSKPDHLAQNCENAELFILSDSDDDQTKSSREKKNADNGSDNSDPIIVDIDSSEASSIQSSKESSDQTKTNMPDLSLVSVTHKSLSLFICKVCDVHFHSLKDLKVHERRTHTKCPFCNKKFRSLASRDEHVKYTCIINNVPFKLKNAKLELTRVEEIEEIRKQYASAFEEMLNYDSEGNPSESGAKKSSTATVSEAVRAESAPPLPPSLPAPPQQPQIAEETSDKRQYDQATIDAVLELEKFLINATGLASSEQIANSALTEGISNTSEAPAAESVEVSTSSNNGDIICISDDEADTSSPTKSQTKPKIKIMNNDILKHINLQDSDANVLKNILINSRRNKTAGAIDALKGYTITDGGSYRVKIFKNLRKHLQHCKIPIEIQYNPNLSVEYKYATASPQKKLTDLWSKMIPRDLKLPVTSQPTKPQLPPPSYNTAVASLSTPQVKNTSLIMRAPNNTSQNVTSTSNIYNNTVSQSPGFVTMAQVASVVSSSSIVPSSSNLIFTSQPSALVTSSINDHCYSSPVVLNGTPNICTNNTSNNITNFILVSAPLIPTAEKIPETSLSLPAAQGPLPIIQYVTSGQELREPMRITEEPITITEEPITITEESSRPPTSSASAQPAIRVKNLSELS